MDNARAAALETRHGDLDARIRAELQSRSADDMEIARLKKEKLRLKDALRDD